MWGIGCKFFKIEMSLLGDPYNAGNGILGGYNISLRSLMVP